MLISKSFSKKIMKDVTVKGNGKVKLLIQWSSGNTSTTVVNLFFRS